MNCFVIMPFAKEFDDVYAAIKTNVEAIISSRGGRCFRLDESRPAGPITDRLLREIRSAAFCVADVTGNIPNVMWEVGYAMALGKPIILMTQKISELPFDIKDLQSLEYDRSQISRTLGDALRKTVLDTVQILDVNQSNQDPLKEQNEFVGTLLTEIADLKNMIGNMVKVWEPSNRINEDASKGAAVLQGAWINNAGGIHLYAKIINNELVAPYCFWGNSHLTGVFYSWRRAGEYWFARFAWIDDDISGFAFVKQDSIDSLTGAWWGDEDYETVPDVPPRHAGTNISLERDMNVAYPGWAIRFFDTVQELGLAATLARRKRL